METWSLGNSKYEIADEQVSFTTNNNETHLIKQMSYYVDLSKFIYVTTKNKWQSIWNKQNTNSFKVPYVLYSLT